jgi:poly(A) polymerase
VRRRDFTINGMLFDPVSGQVIDYVGGKPDLRRRILRTIGNARDRFEEDRLRMMRAVRLACDLDFQIEPGTWEAVKQLSARVLDVSAERIRDELLKILTGPAPARGLDLLQESGLLDAILPEVEAMRGIEQPPEFHPEGDVFVHTRLALGLLRKPSATLAMGTLLHDVGKPATFAVKDRIRFDGHVEAGMIIAGEICRRLRMSNQETEQIVALVQHHLRFMNVMEMRKSTLTRFLRIPHFEDHLELHRVDCLGSHGDLTYYRFCVNALRELKNSPEPSPPLISGNDLIAMGYPPGPRFREILEAVEDLQIEKQLHTPEEAREYVRRVFPA